MSNPTNLAQQLTAYLQANPYTARSLWASALHHLPPEGLEALGARMGADTMGDSLRRQLHTLALERETAPLSLGPK